MNMRLQSDDSNISNIFVKQSQGIVIQGNSIKGSSQCFVKAEGDKTKNVVILSNVLHKVKKIFIEDVGCKGKVKEMNNFIK